MSAVKKQKFEEKTKDNATLNSNCAHFITGKYTCNATFLPAKDYAMVLDNVVKGCCDILLMHNGKVLIGKRNVFPQKSWWFGCGGRMKPGDSPIESVVKLLKRELGIVIDESSTDRIMKVGAYSFVWRLRQQEPMDHGTADISVVHSITITDEEKSAMKIDRNEYDECEWCDPESIANEEMYHPALRRSVSDLLCLQKKQRLFTLVQNGVNDEEIARVCKEYVNYCTKISKRDRESIYVADTLEIEDAKK